jgi:hypothetical protein
MKSKSFSFVIGATLLASAFNAALAAPADAALRLVGRTELPSYTGDFDHFGVDVKGNRLFLAGEDGASLEVFNLRTGAHTKTVKGFDSPHSVRPAAGQSSGGDRQR